MSYENIKTKLANGEPVTLRPTGNSMTPIIKSKQQIVIRPFDAATVKTGDVVLAKVAGKHFIHLVTAVTVDKVQISNNHGHVNGWTSKDKVFGIIRREDIG